MDKKEKKNQYKNRTMIGGIFAIKNNAANKWYVDSTGDLNAMKNRFDFMGDSFTKIAQDYKTQKGMGFVFEVLEELKKGELQSDKEFKDDLALLKSIWLDKVSEQELY